MGTQEHARVKGDLTRRQVLVTMAGSAVVGGCMQPRPFESPQVALPAEKTEELPEIRVVYIRPKKEYWLGWPGTAWDVAGFRADTRAKVEQFAKDPCPNAVGRDDVVPLTIGADAGDSDALTGAAEALAGGLGAGRAAQVDYRRIGNDGCISGQDFRHFSAGEG